MSAPAVNSVTLVGRLTADPNLRALPDGRPVCDLRLAVDDAQDKPLFIDVATFGPGAEACARHLIKGRQVAVVGRLAYRVAGQGGPAALQALRNRPRAVRIRRRPSCPRGGRER